MISIAIIDTCEKRIKRRCFFFFFNVNETVQNLDVLQNMANTDRVDDSDDFFYENPNDPTNEMIYSTNPNVEIPEVPNFFENTIDQSNPFADTVEKNTFDGINNIEDGSAQGGESNYASTLGEEISYPNEVEDKVKETVPEVQSFQLTDKEKEKLLEASSSVKDVDLTNFDAVFASLSSDVNGANNFISNLIEQRKSVNTNEARLIEGQEKLDKEKEEFAKFVEAQKEAIELEKEQCKEYVRTQKIRIANEEAQFNSDVEATRAELALQEQTIKIGNEKLADEKQQFSSYKELEEEKLKVEKQKLETEKTSFAKEKAITEEKQKTERLKLETEREQFMKEKAIHEDKISADRQTLEIEREQFENERKLEAEKLKNEHEELRKQEEQFAKYKELEEKKLELESKNLSQSCTRFKELVSQFNSGFQQLPGDKE